MEFTRRDMFTVGGKLLVLASAGAALEQIMGAAPASDAYKMADHWWGMIIDVDKCTLCYHRITKGLTTACCENCPTAARQLVDFKDPKDPVHEFLRHNKVQVLKPYMATGAKVYYKDLDGSVR